MEMALAVYRSHVSAEWIDYNGHMGDYAYGIVFSDAATFYMDRIGIDADYRKASGATLYTLDSRISYLKECHSHESLQVELTLIDADHRSLHVFMRMLNHSGQEVALCEQLLMHVSREGGSPLAVHMPVEVQKTVLEDLEYSLSVEKKKWIDSRIGLRRK